ncbi:MAG: YncE family protein [Rhodanobacteraceae bacterium]|nr:MAG: YncE family protein [Rhodanobacteraceae bacterium]
MRSLRPLYICLALFFSASLLGAPACRGADLPGTLPLKTIANFPLPGRATRWDYESLDPERHLLFLAHLGDNEVVVFDTQTQKVIATIPDVSRVHGVLAVPSLGRVYASATGTNQVVAIDERTFKIVARMPGGVYPDGIAYAPEVGKLFVSDEHGGTDTVIDAKTNRRIATIPMGGEVGNTQYDPVSRHIFANVQTRDDLVEIDPVTDKIVARYPLPGAQGNHGLLIDPASRLAFIACEGNNKLLVLDMRTMKVIQHFPVGRDPDVLAFDDKLGLLYVASESGVVSLFQVNGQTVTKLGQGLLGDDAHTVAVDPATHKAYFAIKARHGKPVLRVMQPQPPVSVTGASPDSR